MDEHRGFPDTNRLSVLSAAIMLAYGLTPFVKIPQRILAFNVAEIHFEYVFNINTIVSVMVAFLAASGTDWLLRGHPATGKGKLLEHLIIPALTAWIIGVPLNTVPLGLQWWAVLALGGVLLFFVFVAEYIVVDPSHLFHAPATIGLTAVSYAIFLFLAIAVRAAGFRLYLMLPALVLPLFFVLLRTFYLRLGGKLQISWSIAIAFVIGQMAMGLHYLPVTSVQFGLLLLGLAYSLTNIATSLEERRPWQSFWYEPLLILTLLWSLALFIKR